MVVEFRYLFTIKKVFEVDNVSYSRNSRATIDKDSQNCVPTVMLNKHLAFIMIF